MAGYVSHDDLKKFAANIADTIRRQNITRDATHAAELATLRERIGRQGELVNALVAQFKARANQTDTLLARVATLERERTQSQQKRAA